MTAARRVVELDLSDYRPTPSQLAFLRTKARRALFCGGFGSGKTSALVEKVLRLAIINEGMPGIMVSATYQQLRRTLLVEFEKRVPRAIITQHHKSEHYFRLLNGSIIYYGSADNPDSLDGPTLAWGAGDEIRLWHSRAWDILNGRVRLKGAALPQIALASTPSGGWMADVFKSPTGGDVCIRSSTRQNAANLDPEYIPTLERTYSPRVARALIEGEFTTLEGGVYMEWDEKRNLVPWTIQPTCRTVLGVDFGVRHPSVVLAQITPHVDLPTGDGRVIPANSIVVADELHPEDMPTVQLAQKIRDRWPGLRLDAIYCDPAGANRSQEVGMPSVWVLESVLGVRPSWATSMEDRYVANRIALVQGAIAPTTGLPRLYVSDALKRQRDTATRLPGQKDRGVLSMFEGYRYEEGKPTPLKGDKGGNLDHADDALGYLVTGIVRDEGRVPAHLQLVRTYGRA